MTVFAYTKDNRNYREIANGMSKIDIVLIVVLAIILVLVGGKKLPELARGIGQAGKELKKGFREDDTENKKTKK